MGPPDRQRSHATEPPPPAVIVELRHVGKRYKDVVAVDDISFTIAPGEFVTLLGPSGSGKTTLLNLIVGITTPSSGAVFIGGRDATHLEPGKRQIGMVFQHYALMPHMTVFQNLAFPLQIRRVRKDEIRRRVDAILKLVRLPDIATRYPRQLSGGQQQRVSLARCLIYSPSLILMDEPLGALDKKMREQMQLEIKRLHAELGVTMLYVTHDQEEALTMSDRIILMNDGHIEQMATPDRLYFEPVSKFAAAFLGDSNLFDATVVDADGLVTARSGLGPVFHARYLGAPPSRGTLGAILVRPESVTLGSTKPAAGNYVTGTAQDAILLGGVVKHFIRLDDGSILLAQDQNRAGWHRPAPGDHVWATWQPEDALFLPGQPGGAATPLRHAVSPALEATDV
jgi:putative spermidine/putrescine transport system ATP-binding protein